MLRRDFLIRLGAGTSAMLGGEAAFGYTRRKKAHPAHHESPKLERVALSTWSLHNYFSSTRESSFELPGAMLVLLDFPDAIVSRYQIHHFEFCASHFPSVEKAYLQELKYTLVHSRSTLVNLILDIEECGPSGAFSAVDPNQRLTALEAVKSWVDVAHALGAKSVSAGPGKVDVNALEPVVESYKALATYAQAKNVRVAVENSQGFGADDPELLLKLFKLVGHGKISALPDFANFADEEARENGLKALFPYADTLCHAHRLASDAAGAENNPDFEKAMEIAKQTNFRGFYSIDFEGPGDPYAGIENTRNDLLKYL